MPMIIKNNVRYCSTGGDAESIVYDNAESGMEATNMQDAIDELNSNLNKDWSDNLLTNKTHWKNVNLGSLLNYNEISLMISITQDGNLDSEYVVRKGHGNKSKFIYYQYSSSETRIFAEFAINWDTGTISCNANEGSTYWKANDCCFVNNVYVR